MLYDLYMGSISKWEKVKELFNKCKEPNNFFSNKKIELKNLITHSCSFCYNALDSRDYIGSKCNNCKIDKRICNINEITYKKGIMKYYYLLNNRYLHNKIAENIFMRRLSFFIDVMLKSLKWEANNLILNCKHQWKFTGYCWCQECSDFTKAKKMKYGWFTHGTPVSQCINCGLMYEPEYGYFNYEEIENFKFNETIIPHLENIEVRGLWDLTPIKRRCLIYESKKQS